MHEKRSEKRKMVGFTLKTSPEWHDWLKRLSDHCRRPIALTVELSLEDYAKAVGFEESPPRR